MSRPIEKFVTRLSSILGPHDRAETPALLKELHVHLGKFSDEELQEAATILFAGQETKFWPTFGAMTIAAEEARKKLRKMREVYTPLGKVRRRDSIGGWYTPRTKSEDDAYWSREAFEAADNLIQSEIGRKAADEGWIGDLYDFARENRRLPNVNERYSLIKKSKKTDELYAESKGSNRQMMATALNRRDHLASVAYGKGTGWHWQQNNAERIASIARGKK